MKIYNSLTFQKEEFKSIRPDEVLMYVCGPTVYDSPHLGHAKSAVVFDLIRRYLKFKGYDVKLVKNYTDIDDKIIKRANERNIDINTLSEEYIEEYKETMKMLNIEEDYKNPRATDVIEFIIKFVEKLIEKGNAYERNGSVYYSVKTFPDYDTIFQNIKEGSVPDEREILEDQDTAYGEDKDDSRDFALWKKHKEGEPYWDSPWGTGRPGWHIECSAMSINFLGETLDIHGGGQDLKFPHHRNEIAQSEAYSGKHFVNYFMHNGFVNIDDEKMSKSLGNFFLVSDVAKKYDPIIIRFFLISGHYRKSLNYSLDNITQAQKNYEKMMNTIEKIYEAPVIEGESEDLNTLNLKLELSETNITEAMDDDINTPIAIAEIMTLFRDINRTVFEERVGINKDFKDRFFDFVQKLEKIFGIFPNLMKKLEGGVTGDEDEKDLAIKGLLDLLQETRSKLRDKKIFDLSDYIREKLRELGFNIEDK
jgi:cysteinyl-tRNA synthetase